MNRVIMLFFIGTIIFTASSCKLNRQFMFQVPEDFQYSKLIQDSATKEYVIQPGDEIQFDIYTNQGARIVELSTGSPNNTIVNSDNNFVVNMEGFAELPMIGTQKLSGLTKRQAEDYLEEQFGQHFVNPFVIVNVLSRRVFYFNGQGSGKVIPLGNNQVSLVEAIGLAGGISDYSRADQIKLIRFTNDKQEVFLIDLSKIEGAQFANLPLRSGDLIYVEAERRLGQRFARNVTPWFSVLGIVSSSLLLVNFFTN